MNGDARWLFVFLAVIVGGFLVGYGLATAAGL